jgi:hypothetical protein
MAAVTQRPGASQRSSLPGSQCPCISSATGCAGGPVRRPTFRPFALGRIRTAFSQPQVLSSNRVLLRDESRVRDSLRASRREDRALEQPPSGRDRLRPHPRLGEGDHDSRTGHGLVEGSTLRRRPRPCEQPRGRTTRLACPTALARLTPAKSGGSRGRRRRYDVSALPMRRELHSSNARHSRGGPFESNGRHSV